VLSLNSPRFLSWRIPHKWYQRLTLATALAVWGLIVLGGMVRVTDSGTGCGATWPLCHGSLLPNLEYHELVEWNHRFFATLVGFLMIVTVGSTVLWYRKPRRFLVVGLLAATTYLTQALLGGITVLLNLDHTWIAAHMGNSMLLQAMVILLAFFARVEVKNTIPNRRVLKWLALGTLVWTYLALFTGSAVIGSGSELACPEWPQCSSTQILPQTAGEWVSFGHRLAVGVSDVLLLVLGAVIWRTSRDDKRLSLMVKILGLFYISQVFLGAFTVWLGAPEYLKGAHLAMAAATWSALVVLTAFIMVGKRRPAQTDDFPRGNSPSTRRKILPEMVRNYLSLMRLKVIPLLLVPTIASMLIAAVKQPPERSLLELILWTTLGGTLATGGAHTLNQYFERDIDGKMKRTRNRAIVTGKIAPGHALAFGVGLTLLAVVQLWITVNPLAAILSLGGNLFYVLVYTLWLKRTSTQNIVIGGAAGAVPPLVGWAAVTGNVGLPAILFFAIIFFWTPAHFWALALVRQDDYTAAGIPMLPTAKGEAATLRGILFYSVLLVSFSLLPFLLNALSWLYLVVAAGLGLLFIRKAFALKQNATTARAWKLFKYSNTYLALLYLVMVIDRLLILG